jgi:hypothetical protein
MPNVGDASREELNARRRKPNEGILDEEPQCWHSRETTLTLLILAA